MSRPQHLAIMVATRAKSTGRGFSIVELMVVVLVIGLLLALLLPALSSVRRAARDTASLARAKEISAVITAYSQDAREYFPYSAAGDAVNMGDGSSIASSDPFALEYLYAGLVSSHLPWPAFREVWLSPSAQRSSSESWLPPSYLYTWAFAAHPRLWNLDHPPSTLDLGASNWAAIRWPSRKVLILDQELPYVSKRHAQWIGVDRADPVAMAFIDGHASLNRPHEASSPVPNRLQAETGRRRESRIFNTRDGVAGADY